MTRFCVFIFYGFTNLFGKSETADYTGRWNSVSQLMQQVDSQTQNTIPIGILHVDFEYLDERAMVDILLKMVVSGPVVQNVANHPRSLTPKPSFLN